VTDPRFRIEQYDATGTLELREPLMALYLRTHLDQQHNPWYSPERFWQRLVELYAPGRGFGLVAGWIDGTMVGYAFGSPSDKVQDVWEMVERVLPDVPIPTESEPMYIFREFAVDPAHQGKGYGRMLHDALLEGRPERLANLVVRPDNVSAIAAYRAWGWQTVGQEQPFPDSPVMDSMVLRPPID
jgi:GNAT superfamily N-acetyltransferase